VEHPQPEAGASGFQPRLALSLLAPASACPAPLLELTPLLDPPPELEPPLLELTPELEPPPPLLPPLLPPELVLPLPPELEPELAPELEPLLPELEPLLPELEPELLPVPICARSVPSGLPQPVGPSYPGPAVQRRLGLHEPLLPDVTS
jgi:hypothetical protein